MIVLRIAVVAALGLSGPAVAETIVLPSGNSAVLLDVVTDAPGLEPTHRFRFVSPDVTAGADYMKTEADMAHLCRTVALPQIEVAEPRPDLIVIPLADRPVPFGAPDPNAIQFFEAYTPDGGDCLWRDF